MREVNRNGNEVTLSVSLSELRVLLGTFNEALNGGYALPADEWEALVGQPIERADELFRSLLEIAER